MPARRAANYLDDAITATDYRREGGYKSISPSPNTPYSFLSRHSEQKDFTRTEDLNHTAVLCSCLESHQTPQNKGSY